MKPFVEDGTSPVFGLWSVPDLGYLAVAGRGEARQRRDHGHRGRDLHGQGPQRRQAVHDRQGQHRHPRAGLPVRHDERRRLQLLGLRVRRTRIGAPEASASGASSIPEEARWNASGSRCGSCPGRRPSTAAGTRRSGRRCSTRCRAAGARDYSIFLRGDRPVRLSRGGRLRARSARTMAASRVNDRWQAEMAALIDPLTDPGDRLPPAARGDLPPRLTGQPATRSASQRSLTRSWKPWPPSCSLYGYSRISFGPPYALNAA